MIINSLSTNKSLKKLNLSKNFLTDFIAEHIRNLLKGNEDI